MSDGYVFLLGYVFGSLLTLATMWLWDRLNQ
jgi:hypothetical protein